MAKINLYTVQGPKVDNRTSVADTSGLSKYIGYRQCFAHGFIRNHCRNHGLESGLPLRDIQKIFIFLKWKSLIVFR